MSFIASLWSSVLESVQSRYGIDVTTPNGEMHFFVFASWVLSLSLFWSANGLLFICYHFNLFPQYRIQKDQFPTGPLLKKCLRVVIQGQVLQPLSWFVLYKLLQAGGGIIVSGPLPDWTTVVWKIVAYIFISDTAFYFAHRLLHHRALYGSIHKQHHEFKATVGIAAVYAHPIEDVVANGLPTFLGAMITGCHVLTLWLWLALRLWETIDAHSGYSFPLSPFTIIFNTAERHDFHHSKNVGNFGAWFSVWDRLLGTDEQFRLWKKSKAKRV